MRLGSEHDTTVHALNFIAVNGHLVIYLFTRPHTLKVCSEIIGAIDITQGAHTYSVGEKLNVRSCISFHDYHH